MENSRDILNAVEEILHNKEKQPTNNTIVNVGSVGEKSRFVNHHHAVPALYKHQVQSSNFRLSRAFFTVV